MSRPRHFKTWTTFSKPAASELSELLDLGWDTVSIVRGGDGEYTVYLKRIESGEGQSDGNG